MDNDNFSPAFITAARVIGLGSYAVNLLETSGIVLREEGSEGPVNSIGWRGYPEEVGIRERIKGILSSEILEPSHTLISMSTLLMEALYTGGIASRLEAISGHSNKAGGVGEKESKEKSKIKASVGAAFATILDALGQSSFLQLSTPKQTFISWGEVTAAGTEGIKGSGDWTSAIVGTGRYRIFYKERLTPPIILCWTNTRAAAFPFRPEFVTVNTAEILTLNITSLGTLENGPFFFAVIG